MSFSWGPKQDELNPAALQQAIAPEDKPEPSQQDLQEALKKALTEAEVAKKRASVQYQQQVIDENEKRNG